MVIHTITDIEKLRPELLTKSLAELERQQNEIALAIAAKHREAEVKAKAELAASANGHIDAIITGVKWLHDHQMLPERLVTAFSGASGSFMPSSFLRNVTAEGLASAVLGRPRRARGDGPKRHRRTKAEIEAARAAGGK